MLFTTALLAACPLLQDPELLVTLDAPNAEPGFGFLTFRTGDLDLDGRADFAVPSAGRAQVFSSADVSLLLDVESPRITLFSAWVGDANGDGVGDVLTRDVVGGVGRLWVVASSDGSVVTELFPLFSFGSFSALNNPFGKAPDTDGDGVPDLWMVTSSGGSGSMSFLEVRSGASPSQTVLTLSGARRTFSSVFPIPDRTGDGIEEFLVGDDISESNFPFGTIRGRVRILSGTDGAELLRVDGNDDTREFGQLVRPVGDITGDGVEDFAASLRRGSSLAVDVFSGANGDLLHTLIDPTPASVGPLRSDFGDAIVGVGDIDGDRVPDVGVGAPDSNEFVVGGGAAYVYSGATGDLLASTLGLQINDGMGSTLLPAGDLNLDGRDDWFVGSPRGFLGSPGRLEAYGLVDLDVTLTFERDDDFTTPLGNGAALDDAFGRVVRIRSEGAGQVGPATFDSTSTGPNAASSDSDLLVDRGNLLILQEDATQTVPGVYDLPDDAQDGGRLTIELIEPRAPRSLVLVDICPGLPSQDAQVRLVDAAGRERTFVVPGGFTADGELDPDNAARTLHLDTLSDQPGVAAVATASEEADFDPLRVTAIRVDLAGSGAVDDLVLGPREDTPVDPSQRLFTLDVAVHGGASPIAPLGDIDGDGLGELVVGAPPALPSRPGGWTAVYRGGEGSLLSSFNGPAPPLGQGSFGQHVAALGDVDGDGAPEYVASGFFDRIEDGGARGVVQLVDGATGAPEGAPLVGPMLDGLGSALAALSDVDGDGVRDVAVGAHQLLVGGAVGYVDIRSGADLSLLRRIDGPPGTSGFGSLLFGVGDVDGDGVEDVGIGTENGFGTLTRSVFRVHSPTTGAILFEAESTAADGPTDLGVRGGALGDLDGDGFGDFAYTASSGARIRVVSGGTGTELYALEPASPALEYTLFAAPGDLNGDGVLDFVYAGLEPPKGPIPGQHFIAGASGDGTGELFRRFYGASPLFPVAGLTGVGDIDGDGLAEFAARVRDTSTSPATVSIEVLGLLPAPARTVCLGGVSSTGIGSRLRPRGSTSVAANDLRFEACNLPPHAFLLLLVSDAAARPLPVGDGTLCLSGTGLTRLPGVHGGAPVLEAAVDLRALPGLSTSSSIEVGQRRYFQAWFRDGAGVHGSNLTDAVEVVLRP
ncbi:MAG: integrin alpha [Planctomycetota bacterium]